MSERIVYLRGQFVPESEARISIYDSALTMGDMAFEVTRTCRHVPFRLADHLRRLDNTLKAIGTDPDLSLAEIERLTIETLARNLPTEADDVDWNIIHNVSRGPASAFDEAFALEERRPTVVISCYPLLAKLAALAPAYDSGIDLVVPTQRALPTDLVHAFIKTRSRLHYQLANIEAEQKCPGATAVLTDPDGHLTEGTSGNIFLVRNGELQTPEPRNLLPGVTRALVLDLAEKLTLPAREMNLTPLDALSADEVFVTSTTIGILHARSFEGHAIGDGSIGTVTQCLRAALDAEVGLDFAAQARLYAARTGRRPTAS
ncbi:MAG: aminotransferase class IV [Pirellulales bacterium]|nr:aminotransferase class IV [Pirellulales bacterium]